MEYEFRVPYIPPSINQLYGYNPRTKQRYMTEEGRHFKMVIKMNCPPMSFSSKTPFLDMFVEYHSPRWICKNGNLRKIDGMNCDKVLYDAISERIGIDDAAVFIWGGIKYLDKDEYTKIRVKEIEDDKRISIR